jgi:hypothetical protein
MRGNNFRGSRLAEWTDFKSGRLRIRNRRTTTGKDIFTRHTERGRHRGLTGLHTHSRGSYKVEEPSHKGELDDAFTTDKREGCCLVGGRNIERAEEAFVSIKTMDSQPAERTALEQ